MSSAPNEVTFFANLQPAPACYPSDVNGMLTLIAEGGLSGTVPATAGGGIFVSSIPPSSSLTNKVWFVIDAAGRPLGIKMFYNGNWRPVYSGAYGDIKAYNGATSEFDGTGLGIVGSWHDGWAICNGNNGTPDLTARFVAGGSPAADGSWHSSVDGTGSKRNGGTARTTIALGNLPNLQIALTKAIRATGTGDWTTTPVWATTGSTPDTCSVTGTGPDTPLDNTPPWLALGYLMFIGYA